MMIQARKNLKKNHSEKEESDNDNYDSKTI